MFRMSKFSHLNDNSSLVSPKCGNVCKWNLGGQRNDERSFGMDGDSIPLTIRFTNRYCMLSIYSNVISPKKAIDLFWSETSHSFWVNRLEVAL